MQYNDFERIISRYGTYSAKWDEAVQRHHYPVTPLSVADMDFPSAPAVIEAINQANNGIYGYTICGEAYAQTVVDWLDRHYHFMTQPEDIVHCPRVVQAISLFIHHFTQVDQGIGLFTPCYAPIMQCVTLNQRKLVPCPLTYKNQQYHLNISKLIECFQQIKVFILISPHNPTGTVWSTQQLRLICQLAEQYNVFIISDDVHADFVFNGRHQIIAELSDYVAQHSMICTSPAKTFNMPGLEIANIVIQNPKVRSQFQQILARFGFHNPNYFSVPALYAAYTQCDQWLIALKDYIAKNKQIVTACFARDLPQLEITASNGTYLMWINYAKLAISPEIFKAIMLRLAKIELSWGEDFGQEGKYFFRLNVALPQKALLDCLNRIHLALTTYKGD